MSAMVTSTNQWALNHWPLGDVAVILKSTIFKLTMQNRPVSQITWCASPISHNAPFCNRNVHISVTKWCIVGYWTGTLWDLWDWSKVGGALAGPSPVMSKFHLALCLYKSWYQFDLNHVNNSYGLLRIDKLYFRPCPHLIRSRKDLGS